MSLNISEEDKTNLVVVDEIGSDSSPESDVQIIEDETSNDDNTNLVEKLKQENKLLKEKLNNLLNSNDRLIIGPLDNPIATVHFTIEAAALKYRTQIETYLKNLLTPESDEEITEIQCKQSSDDPFFIDNKARSLKHKSRKSQTKYPIYDKEITDVMTDNVVATEEIKIPDDKPRNSCFNCGGDHLLHDCSKPIDRQQIAINRKGFYNKFGGKQSRYHVDSEAQNAKFKPGVLSAELRRALNVGENQLPLHVYRMRILGYPPGWLCEAKVESSGITMYDTHGKEVAEIDEVEEGEVSDGSIRVQFDPDRLIDYPGFNTYPQPGVIDEFQTIGFPPMQEHQLKSSFVRRMKPPTATPYKRKSETELGHKNKKLRIEVDMEIDETEMEETDFEPNNDDSLCTQSPRPLEDYSLLCTPTINSLDGDCINSQDTAECSQSKPESSRPPSPSLEELEKQKNQLMEQLDSADSSNSQSTSSTCVIITTTPKVTHSKSVSMGTPIPEINSSFTNLPDASKFSSTIAEHMNFENLPNSTGSYDKMKVILSKIRRRSLQ